MRGKRKAIRTCAGGGRDTKRPDEAWKQLRVCVLHMLLHTASGDLSAGKQDEIARHKTLFGATPLAVGHLFLFVLCTRKVIADALQNSSPSGKEFLHRLAQWSVRQ